MSNAFEGLSLSKIFQRQMWPLALAVIGSQLVMQPAAYGADETLKGNLKRYSDRMSALATQLDHSAAIAERASRIVDKERGTALKPAATSLRSGGDRASELNMVLLQQLVSERSQAIQLATSLAENLNQQAKDVINNMRDGGAAAAGKGTKPGSGSASRRDPNRIELFGIVTDLARVDVKSEREAGNTALEAVRQAARSEAFAAWKAAPAAKIAEVVPQPVIDTIRNTAPVSDFGSLSLEDALMVVLLLAEADARADLQSLLKEAQDANNRAYHVASKATFAIQFASLHLALAAAERRLMTRPVGPPPDFAFVRHIIYLMENPERRNLNEERKKLQQELKALQKRIKDLQAQLEDVSSRIDEFEVNCAKAILEAGKAAAAAGVGSAIGGFFGGPLGAAIGGAVGVAVSGGSPQDISNIAVCLELKALKEELARIVKELGELSAKMKEMQSEIARKQKEIEENMKTIQRAADREVVVKERDSRAARTKPVAPGTAIRQPCGGPDNPCSAAVRRNIPGGSSAMDRLSGGSSSVTGSGTTSAGSAARPRSSGAAAPAASGSAGGTFTPTINRNAVGVSSAPERLR